MKLWGGCSTGKAQRKGLERGAAGGKAAEQGLSLGDKLHGPRWGRAGAVARSGPREVRVSCGSNGQRGGGRGTGEETLGAGAGSRARVTWLSKGVISGAGGGLGLPRVPLVGLPGA